MRVTTVLEALETVGTCETAVVTRHLKKMHHAKSEDIYPVLYYCADYGYLRKIDASFHPDRGHTEIMWELTDAGRERLSNFRKGLNMSSEPYVHQFDILRMVRASGTTTISGLADALVEQGSRCNKQVVYQALKRLRKRGFVDYVPRHGKGEVSTWSINEAGIRALEELDATGKVKLGRQCGTRDVRVPVSVILDAVASDGGCTGASIIKKVQAQYDVNDSYIRSIISRLCKKGLMEKQMLPTVKRQYAYILTDAGRQTLSQTSF